MRNFDLHEQFEAVKASAINSIRSIFPIQGKLRTLKIDEIWVEDSHGMKDYADQLAVKNKEGTWGVPVYANMSLVDRSSGKILDREKKVKIFNLPKVTDRLSYIVKGNEYQVTNQFRLKPGVYTLRKQNGELKTQINLSKGKNFDIVFDENKGLFTIQKIGGGQANIPLYPLLVHLGMSAQAMVGAWGAKIEAANRLTDPKIVARTATAFGVRKGTLKEYLASTEISKETTKVTLGHEFDRVDGPMLLASSKALLETHLGKKEPVDRDSLAFKELWSVEDFIHERIEKNKTTLEFKLGRNIDNLKRTKISQIVNPAAFSGLVETFFTQDDKSSTPEQTNPVEMIAGQYRATVMGSGGIKSDHAITNVMREIHPSHYGFVDPIHSPEGNVGVNLNLPLGIVKDGKDIKMTVTDSRTNQKVFLKPTEAFDKVIAFPNQSGAKVKALHKGKFIEVARDKVDYFTPNPMALFAPSTNLVPYLPTDQGNRAMMASKMMEQAISLKHREAPLVQVGISSNQTMEGVMGNIIAVKATEDGIIKKVTPDYLTLQNKDGEIKKINLYNNYPLNRKSFLTHNSTVKVGDKVKQGQLLAESNFTKDGVLALGTNLRTAYLPYKGRNFDDGIVITESAAEKLTSEHIHKKTYEVDDNSVLDLVGFKTNYPNILSMENSGNLDSRGIIKKGAKVKNGDVLIAALKRRPASASLNLVSKKLSNRPKDDSLTWTMEDDGTVMDVVKTPRSVTVMIKTEERAKIGDKLAGRHGNKGVITHIIPDSHAPHDKEGNPVDMLLNPTGVISRINIGQIYESAAGKAALKNKEVYNVSNFTGEDYLKTTKEYLKKSGVDDKEELFDPHTKKSLGQIHVGNPHILKLFKQSTANYSVRQGGPGNPYDANMQPTKGGEEGSKAQDLLTLYSMLSHGARANLREMSSIKSTSNDEYWKALKSGQQLPPPKPSFAYEKFMSYLKGSGIDVKKNGSKLTLAPLTDKQLSEMSNGEITKPVFFRGKDNQPMKGGFFDPVIMGGFNGEKWGHIALHEPVVNPVFEKAARSVVGIGKKFDELLAGTLHINPKGEFNTEGKGVSGGAAIAKLLSAVDVEKEIDSQMTRTKRATGPQLDEANKRLRYLMALKENGLSPTEAYIRKNIPVLPTTYRPIYPRPDGSLISSNTNYIYQNIGILNNMMDAKKMPVIDLLPEEDKAALRSDLYNHIKGLSGLTDITIKGKPRDGFIAEIKGGTGGQPKEGFFISKLLSKKQDFVGRGTIIPEPDLHVDEMGMPEEMAWKLFEPFVIREMKNHGKTPLQAKDEINNKTPLAKKALELVMADRHVLLNRAPSLHKFSIMAFRPKITEGRSIKVQPLINTGFNSDFDGDTMTIHLPISDEANREAAKMLPSRNLFQPGTGKLMIIPSQEAQIGLFYMSGTTKGRATLNKLLPKSHQITSTLDKKVTQDFLRKIAKDLPSNDFGNIVTMLKMEGEKHSYEGGFTLGLNDLTQLDHHKDTLIKNMEHHLLGAKTEGERAAIGKNYTGKLDQLISNKLKGKHNPLFDMIESGAKGSISQLRSIVATPLLVTDAKGRTIYKPIKKSYTEGLDMGDYWVSMYGARRGMIDRSLQSSEPGAFSKDIMATTLDNVISGEDCGTKEGITFRLENTDAVDRFMAGNQGGFSHNTLVDSSVISRLKKAGIQSVKVRSPLKCLRPKGTCAKCYGLDENGHPPEIGDNIGAKAGQTIAEPLMQLTMNSFHTGGTVGSGLSGYPRIKQLLLLPKIVTGAATLSPLDGKIKKIEKGVAGGFNVTIGDKDSSHTAYVSKDLDLKVKLGQAISAGDPLSTGVIKPQDLVKHKGMYAAQEYITDELQKAYQSQGIGRSRKIFETIVRSLGNTTKVLNNPKGTGHVPGDIIPYTVAQHHNQNLETDVAIDESVGHKLSKSFEGLKSGHEITREDMLLLKAKGQATAPIKNDPIVHAPLLKGLSTLPMLRRDWMSGLGYRYLAKTLVEGAGQGWSTDLEDYHPIPAFAHGATFGQGKDGKY